MKGWIEIFKAGSHTDSKGRVRAFAEKDLDKIVESYDPARHEAPVVIGHPQDNGPAWAWVEGLKRVGRQLFYKEKGAAPEFTEMRKEGRFKKRSISLYPDGSLRHIGWLGAMPPAVKGLQDVKFNETDGCTDYEFSEEEPDMGEIEELKKKLAEEKAARKKAEGAANDYKEQASKATADFAAATATAAEEQKKQRRTDLKNFVEQGVKDARILPAWEKAGLLDFMAALDEQDGTYEFSEGKKESPLDWFKGFLSDFSEHPLFKDMAKPTDDKTGNSADFEEDMADADDMANYVNDEADGK